VKSNTERATIAYNITNIWVLKLSTIVDVIKSLEPFIKKILPCL